MRFGKNVTTVKQKLVTLLKRLKNDGKKITGYGATAKGNTLLNYCGIGTDILDYVSDTTPFKQGHYTPGMHVPIVSEDRFHKEPPDYALLLAWNYADAILEKEKKYRENGGKFILPVPESEVVGND
jgi:methylation protein EvaC